MHKRRILALPIFGKYYMPQYIESLALVSSCHLAGTSTTVRKKSIRKCNQCGGTVILVIRRKILQLKHGYHITIIVFAAFIGGELE